MFLGLQKENLIRISVTCLGLDSTSIKVHLDAEGALKKTDPNPSGNQVADVTMSRKNHQLEVETVN